MSDHIECNQVDRLKRIEDDVLNHKVWRNETSTQLSNIEISLATLNERLKSKMEGFEEHVKAGTAFRGTVIGIALTLALSIFSAVFAYGGLANQVKTNTERWDRVLAETHVDLK